MTSIKQKKLCQQLGIQFKNETLLLQALTHRSADPKNNERLEFLGDAILSFVIAEELFNRFPQAKEGKMSRLRASLVKGALFLDSGIDIVKPLILRLYDERLDSIDVTETVKDPKTRLQELLQSRKLPLPLYSVREIESADKQPVFEASCQVSLLNKLVVAQGSSHRKAEKKAAERALTLIESKL
mgnify:CR=1 FL=1